MNKQDKDRLAEFLGKYTWRNTPGGLQTRVVIPVFDPYSDSASLPDFQRRIAELTENLSDVNVALETTRRMYEDGVDPVLVVKGWKYATADEIEAASRAKHKQIADQRAYDERMATEIRERRPELFG